MVKAEVGRVYDLKYGVYYGVGMQEILRAGTTLVVLKIKWCFALVMPVPAGQNENRVWVNRTDLETAIGGQA